MSNARDDIIARVRTALGRDKLPVDTRRKLDRRLSKPPDHPKPVVEGDPAVAFESALTAVQGGFCSCRSSDVMDTIAACLDHRGLDRTLIAAPALEGLAWPADWAVTFGASKGDDRVSVTPCFAAVAETGSVVLLSSPDSPTSLNFLPDFHIVLVNDHQLVRHVEDVWTRLRKAGVSPRVVNFITGPSKTADVEQTIQYGAHGPRSLDVILISDG